MTEKKIDHRALRFYVSPAGGEELPREARLERDLERWARGLQGNAMRITAAGVLRTTGSLALAADVLYAVGYRVPPGYFPLDHEAWDLDEEEALRVWVEQEAERIAQVHETIGFYLAASGKLMDKFPRAAEADEEEGG